MPSDLSNCTISSNNKSIYVWNQNVLFGYFWAGIYKRYYNIWNQPPQFWKTIIILEISTLKFILLQSLAQELISLHLGRNIPALVFLGWNLKIILPYLEPAPSSLSNYKVCERKKCLNLTKKMTYLGIFRLEF